MSIARAFTVRLRRHGASSTTSPSAADENTTMRRMASVVDRSKISGPVELISSTNMLSYDAPDVAAVREMRQVSSSSSSSAASTTSSSGSTAGDDSDSSDNASTSAELTDASSVDASSPCEPEPNHLSCYFEAAQLGTSKKKKTTTTTKSVRRSASTASTNASAAPAVPARALSHSKSSHIALARKRSVQSLSSGAQSPPRSVSRASSVREKRGADGAAAAAAAPEAEHPFGRELEKLSEVVEELGGWMREAEDDDDARVMSERGLAKCSVEEYLSEVCALYVGLADFAAGNHPAAVVPAWI